MAEEKVILSQAEISNTIESLVDQILAEFPDLENVVILGIRTRGATLADRVRASLENKIGRQVIGGILDITLYRDDLSALSAHPIVRESEINFDLNEVNVVVIDDVLYTGRTIRAAINEIVDFGRPNVIRLGVLIDRGCHEYPIRADYTGKSIETTRDQHIKVRLQETDDHENVILISE